MEQMQWSLSRPKSASASAQSLQNHPVWQMTITDASDNTSVAKALQRKAQELLARGETGGTVSVLRCIVFVAKNLQPQSLSHSQPSNSASPSAQDQVEVVSTSPMKPALSLQLTVLLIFEGEGRMKASIKRTITRMIDTGAQPVGKELADQVLTQHQMLASLQHCTFEQVLHQVSSPQVFVDAEWLPGLPTVDLRAYLARRAAGSSVFSPSGAAVMATVGLDLLGPKRPSSAQHQPWQKRLKGPEPSSSLQGDAAPAAAGPSTSGEEGGQASDVAADSAAATASLAGAAALTELLQFDGSLTEPVAADRATELLGAFHSLTEELCEAKLQLNYYQQRDALEAQVRPFKHTRGANDSQYVPACLCDAQRLSRSQLQVSLRQCQDTTDELVKKLHQQVSDVRTMCLPIKPLATATNRSLPSLQLMYFGATAMTQGLPATHSPPVCLSPRYWRSSAVAADGSG